MASNKSSSGSQTVDRALQILECFTLERTSLTLTEASSLTGLTVPTAHRLLKALQAREFLVLDQATHRYSLGPGAMRLSGVIMQRDDVHAVAIPHLERLRALTEETVALHWLVEDYRVCVLELVSRHFMRMTSGTGRRYPLHIGAAGKALLAFLPEETTNRILDRTERDWPGISFEGNRNEFTAQLEQISEQGYATSFGEVVEGAAALAAPILDANKHPITAINVTGPALRFTRERMESVIPILLESVSEIESQLGHGRQSGTF